MLNEWHNTFKNSHVFTKYLIYSKYLEECNVDALISANSFFESYLDKYYHFDDLKNQVQHFLFQYRKLTKTERSKITNRVGYLTNAIKSNQRSLEWKASDEFKQLQKVKSLACLIRTIDEYIYWYNHERIKLTLGGYSLIQYRLMNQ